MGRSATQRLVYDPAMSTVVNRDGLDRQAASTGQMDPHVLETIAPLSDGSSQGLIGSLGPVWQCPPRRRWTVQTDGAQGEAV